jgi:hypothetical protein
LVFRYETNTGANKPSEINPTNNATRLRNLFCSGFNLSYQVLSKASTQHGVAINNLSCASAATFKYIE